MCITTARAGRIVGLLSLEASAKVNSSLPFEITVPGRLVADKEKICLLIKKTGLFWAEPATAEMDDSLKEVAGKRSSAVYEIQITPCSAQLADSEKSNERGPVPSIDARRINDGKVTTLEWDTTKSGQQPFRFEVRIPADQVPGRYVGKLSLALTGSAEINAPSEIPFEIVVEPSPWEKVAPIAIPIFLLLAITCVLWAFFWLRSLRRK